MDWKAQWKVMTNNTSFVHSFGQNNLPLARSEAKKCHKDYYTHVMIKSKGTIRNPNVAYLVALIYMRPRLFPSPTQIATSFGVVHIVELY